MDFPLFSWTADEERKGGVGKLPLMTVYTKELEHHSLKWLNKVSNFFLSSDTDITMTQIIDLIKYNRAFSSM